MLAYIASGVALGGVLVTALVLLHFADQPKAANPITATAATAAVGRVALGMVMDGAVSAEVAVLVSINGYGEDIRGDNGIPLVLSVLPPQPEPLRNNNGNDNNNNNTEELMFDML